MGFQDLHGSGVNKRRTDAGEVQTLGFQDLHGGANRWCKPYYYVVGPTPPYRGAGVGPVGRMNSARPTGRFR